MHDLRAEPAGLTVPTRLSLSDLADLLGEQQSCFDVTCVESCLSTNDELAQRPPGAGIDVLITDRQLAGRGRRGRSWLSEPGHSLTFSCGWNPPAHCPPPGGLSLVIGLAVAEALESVGARGVAVKWPNDVLAGGAKLAGILIELASGQQRTRRVIIGIGLNLRDPADSLPPGATALAPHLCTPISDEAVLAAILLHLNARLLDFTRAGFAALLPAWQARDAFAGHQVRIVGDHEERHGIHAGVAEDGALLLRDHSGIHRILSGDVSLRSAA